jgi:hypothetical protein
MINALPSLKLAETLSGAALADYLVRNGWSEHPSRVEGISILSRPFGRSAKTVELILPVVPGFIDENRRVADALRTVEATEGRPMKSIVDDVHRLMTAQSTGPEVRPRQGTERRRIRRSRTKR